MTNTAHAYGGWGAPHAHTAAVAAARHLARQNKTDKTRRIVQHAQLTEQSRNPVPAKATHTPISQSLRILLTYSLTRSFFSPPHPLSVSLPISGCLSTWSRYTHAHISSRTFTRRLFSLWAALRGVVLTANWPSSGCEASLTRVSSPILQYLYLYRSVSIPRTRRGSACSDDGGMQQIRS